MMKKFVLFFAVAAMVSFVACTGSKTEGTEGSTDSVAVTEVAAPAVDSLSTDSVKVDSVKVDSAVVK